MFSPPSSSHANGFDSICHIYELEVTSELSDSKSHCFKGNIFLLGNVHGGKKQTKKCSSVILGLQYKAVMVQNHRLAHCVINLLAVSGAFC